MLNVSEVMREPIFIDKDENLMAAIELLDRKKDTHVVATDEGRVVGILSVKDILRVVLDRLRWGQPRIGKLYISSVMTSNPIYVNPDDNVLMAIRKMLENGISSVLVAETLADYENVYILTKRDILLHWEEIYDKKTIVETIMTKNPIFVNPGTSIKHAEWLIREKKISTLPVIEGGVLVGYVDVRILALEVAWAYFKGEIKHTRTYLEETTIEEVMAKPHYLPKNEDVVEVAKLLVQKKVKGTPILSDEKPDSRVVGVVTETDLIKLILKEIK